MTDTLNWFNENKEQLIALLTGIVTVASIIATMTPNNSDNKIVGKINKVVSWLALNVGRAKSE